MGGIQSCGGGRDGKDGTQNQDRAQPQQFQARTQTQAECVRTVKNAAAGKQESIQKTEDPVTHKATARESFTHRDVTRVPILQLDTSEATGKTETASAGTLSRVESSDRQILQMKIQRD